MQLNRQNIIYFITWHHIQGTKYLIGILNEIIRIPRKLLNTKILFLFQTHLICTVPSYIDPTILEPVTVQVFVAANGKKSESHNFVYTSKNAQCFPSYAIQSAGIEGNY